MNYVRYVPVAASTLRKDDDAPIVRQKRSFTGEGSPKQVTSLWTGDYDDTEKKSNIGRA